jgi:8-oxo-dGTP pyrophosphatase MutT (NUDIX family)
MANEVKVTELHRIVLTAIIYTPDRKYLITKRSPNQKAYPNQWTVPGGGVEPDDYLSTPKTTSTAWYRAVERALHREVKEEANLEIGKPEYLLDLIFIRPDGIPVLVLSYFAPFVSGEVTLDPEDSTEYAWVTAHEAKTYDLIEGILEEIQEVDEILVKRNQ